MCLSQFYFELDKKRTSSRGRLKVFARGGHNISKKVAPPCKNLAPLCVEASCNRGGKYLLPSFIMIWLSELFWHCIF